MKKKMTGLLIVLAIGAGVGIWGYTSLFPPKVYSYTVQVEKQVDIEKAIEKRNPEVDPQIRGIISESVKRYSEQYNLDPALVISVMAQESDFRYLSKSSKECVGLMQINPAVHKEKLKGMSEPEWYHIDKNIKIGCWILSDYIRSSRNIRQALLKYSGGLPGYDRNVLAIYGQIHVEGKEG